MMDDKVIAFRGVSLGAVTGAVEPDVVAMLSLALQQAERGEIVAIAMVKVKPNGHVGHCWENPGGDGHLLVAGAAYLQHELLINSDSRAVPSIEDEPS